jgi:hypothetical protein
MINYSDYGGRGIQVCERWRTSFMAFLADMGERPSTEHSLDRIDNDGNYEPGNCRWATKQIQARNRRCNRVISLNGEARTVAEWSELLGVSPRTIYSRLNKGQPIERALSTLDLRANRRKLS